MPFWRELKNEGYFLKRISKSQFCNSKGLLWPWVTFLFLFCTQVAGTDPPTLSQSNAGRKCTLAAKPWSAPPGLEGHGKSKDVQRELYTLVIPGFYKPRSACGRVEKQGSIPYPGGTSSPSLQLLFAAWAPLGWQCLCVITQYWCTSARTIC